MRQRKTLRYRDSEISVKLVVKNGYRAYFCSSRFDSSRNDFTSFKHNSRGKDNCLQSQPAAFGMVHKDLIELCATVFSDSTGSAYVIFKVHFS